MNSAIRMTARRATNVDAAVAERIRVYRKARNLSQSELAGQLGVTFQQVQKYEKGTNRIGAGRLFELAKVLDVPIQAFFPVEPGTQSQDSTDLADQMKRISDFVLTTDGWRLCQAFLSISDAKRRKSIISLVQELKTLKDK